MEIRASGKQDGKHGKREDDVTEAVGADEQYALDGRCRSGQSMPDPEGTWSVGKHRNIGAEAENCNRRKRVKDGLRMRMTDYG
jgi:hypothetical protein